MEKAKTTKILKILSNILTIVLLIIIGLLLIRNTCFLTIVISGNSMSPTLNDKEYGYAIKTKYAKNHIKRFAIMVFEDAITKKDIIKRVIGLPGETIMFKDQGNELYVNGELVDQYFISEEIRRQTFDGVYTGFEIEKEINIPNDSYFVLGDNRSNSKDSLHGLGYIEQKQVLGVLSCVFAKCQNIYEDNSSIVCDNKKYHNIKFF